MLRRVGWTLLSAVIGYVLAIVVTFVVLSVAYESRVNRLAVRPDRDRWAFLGALAGLVVGGVAGWWWSGRHPAADADADAELVDGEEVSGADEASDGGPAADEGPVADGRSGPTSDSTGSSDAPDSAESVEP